MQTSPSSACCWSRSLGCWCGSRTWVTAGAGNSTIAVLPFQNLSGSPDGEVLALGIAESVLHQMANLAELDVISRKSSFAFRDRAGDLRSIGRELGARYLLEGSVQSDGAQLRVTTQLIDTESGADVWSMRFDRPTGDIFVVQDEIALQVTQALELSVDPAAIERMTGQGTSNLNAYLAFLQGRALLANNRVVDTNEAIGRLRTRGEIRRGVCHRLRQPGGGGVVRRRVRGRRRSPGSVRGGLAQRPATGRQGTRAGSAQRRCVPAARAPRRLPRPARPQRKTIAAGSN